MKKQRFLACDLKDNFEFQSDVSDWYSRAVMSTNIVYATNTIIYFCRIENGKWAEFFRVSAKDKARMKDGDEAALMRGALRQFIEWQILMRTKYRHLLVRSKLRAGRSNYTTPTRKTGDWL